MGSLKRFAAVITVLSFLSSLCMCVNAKTNIRIEIEFDIIKGKIIISGEYPAANEWISAWMENPNSTDAAVSNNIQHHRAFLTDASGKFSYEFQLYLDGNNDYGNYKLHINSPLMDSPFTTILYYPTIEEQTQCANSFIHAENFSDIITAVQNDNNKNILGLKDFSLLFAIDTTKFAQRVFTYIKNIQTDESNILNTLAQIKNTIIQYAILEAYNQNMASKVFGSDGSFLYPDLIGFESLDDTYKITAYDAYNTVISSSGMSEIRACLLGNNLDTVKQLHEMLIRSIALIGPANPKSIGYGHIKKILSKSNCSYLGMNLKSTFNDDVIVNFYANVKKYSSIDELQNALNNAFEKTNGAGGDSGSVNKSSTGSRVSNEQSYPVGTSANNNLPKEAGFTDLDDVLWAQKAIMYLVSKGIINGTENGKFSPNDMITREQFAKILCLAANIEASDDVCKFEDAVVGQWYVPYISTLKNKKMVNGISDTIFGIGEPITRQDLCVMAYRALKGTLDGNTDEISFFDSDEISDYAIEAVSAFAVEKIVSGYENNVFMPLNYCSRAEAAVIIYKLLNA